MKCSRCRTDLAQGSRPKQRPLMTSFTQAVRKLEQRILPGARPGGMPTGFDEVDRLIGGLRPGQVIVLAGRPGMGQTMLALNLAMRAAHLERTPALILSPEVSEQRLVESILSAHAEIDRMRFGSGYMEHAHWQALTRSCSALVDTPLYIDDRATLTIRKLDRITRKWIARQEGTTTKVRPCALIVIDSIHRIRASERERHGWVDWSRLAETIRRIAEDTQCCIIVTTRVSAAVGMRTDARPRFTDLRPFALERIANVVGFLYRAEMYEKEHCAEADRGIAELSLAKNDAGPRMTVRLRALEIYSRFESTPPAAD